MGKRKSSLTADYYSGKDFWDVSYQPMTPDYDQLRQDMINQAYASAYQDKNNYYAASAQDEEDRLRKEFLEDYMRSVLGDGTGLPHEKPKIRGKEACPVLIRLLTELYSNTSFGLRGIV